MRSPQWLRSKWWNIKRQVTNHKEIPFSGTHTLTHTPSHTSAHTQTIMTNLCSSSSSLVLLKGLHEVVSSSSQTSAGQGSSTSSSASSSSLQIRLTRLEENSNSGSPTSSPVAALQIPVQIPLQITHVGESSVCVLIQRIQPLKDAPTSVLTVIKWDSLYFLVALLCYHWPTPHIVIFKYV